MTVPELDLESTDNIVKPSKFFPADINVPHHQLRNFISTAYEDKIYFVQRYDIEELDLRRQQRSLVATVPFEARCLAAKHGWICVGGETKGDCAFVRISEGDHKPGHFGHDLIVEALGKEIVNSMTIHRVPAKTADQLDEVVVLISNNDKSVTLYSLSQQEILCVLPHPVPMNYASMSPDCTIIAAVGDSNEVYIYQRQETESEDKMRDSPASFQEYNWRPFAVPRIPAGDGVWDDFSFAVAFSSSGRYCAVSAKGGAISVFNMRQLLESRNNSDAEDALLCTFKSSRSTLWGCVRSLSFSPEPWDLLAWTEDHGRIGIADIRRGFVRRQCLSLDRDATEVVELTNATPKEYGELDVKERLKHQYMQRMLALRGHPPAGARSLEAVRRQQGQSNAPQQDNLDLDARERSVLEALETAIDDVEHSSIRPYSVTYTNSSATVRPSASSAESRREYDVQLLNPGTHVVQHTPAPRRRTSVVLSDSNAGNHLPPPTESHRAIMTASPAQMSENSPTPPMSTNDLTPSAGTSSQPMPYNIPPSDPWHVIEAQLATDRATERNGTAISSSNDHPANLAQIEAAIYAERQLTNRLERQLADERRFSALLRTEIEARERLFETRQGPGPPERSGHGQLSPSLERMLQRQLQNEQEHGRERSSETELEILSNSRRVERLMGEREALLLRAMDTQDHPTQPNNASARVSTSSQMNAELERDLRDMEQERRTHRQRIQDLELQLRRAESRIEIASAQSRSEQNRDSNERISDARFLAATTRPGYTPASLRRAQQMDQYGVPHGSRGITSNPSAHTSRLRTTAATRRSEATTSELRSTLPRMGELAGRVTENEMRLARSMLHAAVMDVNGNWIPGHAVRRIAGQQMRMGAMPNMTSRTSAFEELLRESGVGTAGIGWNTDGSYLYTGSEMGIFEFKLNLQDRMQFPSLEMR